ncbi:MAG: cob(I)yrinic acid a,c-diamide adenosyltransferase [Thiotrichaceae bacterium]
MASIATTRGDAGQTTLAGGEAVSKSDLRVEACGTVDELNAHIGLARAWCVEGEIANTLKLLQRELFIVAGELATPKHLQKHASRITQDTVDNLTAQIQHIEKIEGILLDWAIAGEHPAAAALDVARTVCRRAERTAVKLHESEALNPHLLAYLNRLSDLLWLFGRWVELLAGADARLRGAEHRPTSWSKAW